MADNDPKDPRDEPQLALIVVRDEVPTSNQRRGWEDRRRKDRRQTPFTMPGMYFPAANPFDSYRLDAMLYSGVNNTVH